MSQGCRRPTRAAAGSGRTPCTHGEGLAPLRTPIRCDGMPSAWCACLRADISRQLLMEISAQLRNAPIIYDPTIGITEACAGGFILLLAFFAGGSGACYAPDGEREGRSPLANREPHVRKRGAR